jgi:sugar phosphate isomerase/epimerase
LEGCQAVRDLSTGDFFYATDLGQHAPRGRQFKFRRPWGLAVRYHDVAALTRDCAPSFLEFHFSYNDLEIDPAEVFTGILPMGFTTHSPDLFSGDFLLNLASTDDHHWQRSISELQRVIDLTRQLRQHFAVADKPVVVASLGGFTNDAHVLPRELPAMYHRVAEGLAKLDLDGVRLCAQTLPPFPWYLGGQLFCNLFVRAQDTAEFARDYNQPLCLDVSHSKLAANFFGQDFAEFVSQVAPYTQHLHLVDAVGVDGEGVQVGEGEIDWPTLANQLDELCPEASFIPEIWQGHVNDGEGFWVALNRLEEWF